MKIRHKQFWVGFLSGFFVALIVVGGLRLMTALRQEDKTAIFYKQDGVTIKWLPETVTRFSGEIEQQAKRYNVDANLVAILMTLESGGYTKADSGVARGLMQVTPPTASDIAKKHLKQPLENYDLFDSATSIEFGVAYLNYLRNSFCKEQAQLSTTNCAELIAAGYNGGPGAAISLASGEGLKADETLIYSGNVRNMWREKDAAKSLTYQRWLEAGGKILINKAKQE